MPDPAPSRSVDLLDAAACLLVLVDVQERLLPAVAEPGRALAGCLKLARAAGLAGVPVAVTEQYPKGLGRTVPELRAALDALPGGPPAAVEKLRFSAAAALGWTYAAERDDNRYWAVVAGLEAHVCVLQTAFDLLSMGYRVAVPADAVASRGPHDRDAALVRLRDHGVVVTTVESVLFEWCESADHPAFRQIQSLITDKSEPRP